MTYSEEWIIFEGEVRKGGDENSESQSNQTV